MVICLYLCLLLTLLNHDMCYADGKAKAKIGTEVFPDRAEQQRKPSGSTGEPRVSSGVRGQAGREPTQPGKIAATRRDVSTLSGETSEHCPESPAPSTHRGPARWCWRDGQTARGQSIPRSPPWLRLPKCFLRNACLMITGSLSYILGKHGPKVSKHHEQTHLSARHRDGESPVARKNKLLSIFFRPCLQQQSSF